MTTTTTVATGIRTESAEINIPVELLGKKFKITDIYISAITSKARHINKGDNLLVGLIIGGKPLLFGAKQAFNTNTTSLDMLHVPIIYYSNTLYISSRETHRKLLSEIFINVQKLKIVYSNISTLGTHYLIYLTIGGVI